MLITIRSSVISLTVRVLGTFDFDAGLQHRRGHHKNNQQHQHHVHQRRDVDVGERNLCPSVRSGECHYRRTSRLQRAADAGC